MYNDETTAPLPRNIQRGEKSLPAQWSDYRDIKRGRDHTVSGDVRVLNELYSPQLHNRREILVYLPPSYTASDRTYPVVYMHDGQNLFDTSTSFAGEWGVDETMEELSGEGIEAIVVGIPNLGTERTKEYSPFVDRRHGGGRGDLYVDFIADTLKPTIDSTFRTRPEQAHTGIFGSSMGGLISLYAFFQRPETFGFVGAMSPSFWFAGGAILPYIRSARPNAGRIYLDVGEKEAPSTRRWWEIPLLTSLRKGHCEQVASILARKGASEESLRFVVDPDGEHNEAAWRRRLPDALRFLLG
ncbi:MAG: alpha/beta hydrolase [Caldilineaceae bacterium]|nr:alpha/beta hydrolase [Caldilineaceae bacterium]